MDRLWNNKRIFKDKMIEYPSLKHIEEKIFGKKSKYKLKNFQKKENDKDFENSKILISGAAGSIGKALSLKLKQFKITKIIFLDKDENGLTELNREINLNFKKKIIRDYICQILIMLIFINFKRKNYTL